MTKHLLSFGFSRSPNYERAIALASRIPGYSEAGEGRDRIHAVPITHERFDNVAELVDLTRGWKSARLLVDDVQAGPGALHRLLSVLACFRDRELSGLEELHCWGLPEWPRGTFPCRLIERAVPWHLEDHYADPQVLPRLVDALARRQMTEVCPVFDAEGVRRAALKALAAQEAEPRDDEDAILLRISIPESAPGENGASSVDGEC